MPACLNQSAVPLRAVHFLTLYYQTWKTEIEHELMSKPNRNTKVSAAKATTPAAAPAPVQPAKPSTPPAPVAAPAAAVSATRPALGASKPAPPSSPVQPAKPVQPPTPATAPAPRINRVQLELVRPEAKHVCVAGSFNGWKPEATPLKLAGNGRWVGDLNVQPGRHEYLFVVDGQWMPDPNAKEAVANPFGGTNSVLLVRE